MYKCRETQEGRKEGRKDTKTERAGNKLLLSIFLTLNDTSLFYMESPMQLWFTNSP